MPALMGLRTAFFASNASSGASSTSLYMNAKPTTRTLASSTMSSRRSNVPPPNFAPINVVIATNMTYSW